MKKLPIRRAAVVLTLAMATYMFQPLRAGAQAAATVSTAQVAGVVTAAEKALGGYIFPDVGARAIARLRARLPDYQRLTDPAALVVAMNVDLAATTHDKHIRVSYPNDAPGESSGGAVRSRGTRQPSRGTRAERGLPNGPPVRRQRRLLGLPRFLVR